MAKKKNIEIEEISNEEEIEVTNTKDLTLDSLALALAELTDEHRKLVIKTAKRFAKAYKGLEEIREIIDAQNYTSGF